MTAPDPVMERITALITASRNGPRGQVAERFAALWEELTDPVHRSVLAHYAADVQDDPRAELEWDERALAAADAAPPGAGQGTLRVSAFYPSLHLNLAEDHRRLGDPVRAREHLASARARLDALDGTDPGYADTIRTALDRLAERLQS